MSANRNTEYLVGLVRELRKLPRETEWVEFKVSNGDPTVGTKSRSYLPCWAAPAAAPDYDLTAVGYVPVKIAAHGKASRLGHSTAHAFVDEKQFRVQPLCEQDGRRFAGIQSEVGRWQLAIVNANPASALQAIEAWRARALFDDFYPDRARHYDLSEENVQQVEGANP